MSTVVDLSLVFGPVVLFFVGVLVFRWTERRRARRKNVFFGFDFSDQQGGALVMMEHDRESGVFEIFGHHAIPPADVTGAPTVGSDSPYGAIPESYFTLAGKKKLVGPFDELPYSRGYWPEGRRLPWYRRVFRGGR